MKIQLTVVNDSMRSIDFRKMQNPRSRNFQDEETPFWGIRYRSQPQICAKTRETGTKRASFAVDGAQVRGARRSRKKLAVLKNGAIMSDD